MSKAALFIPLTLFFGLAIILGIGFTLDDPHKLPSAMIDQEISAFSLPRLKAPEQQISNADLKGEISLLNVWATWCPNCRVEHPEFMRIAEEEDIRIIGVNYNDERKKALKWLDRLGDPYAFSVMDYEGKLGINLGVYGAPETYLVDSNGVVRYRHVGVVTRKIWEETFVPRIDKLRQNAAVAER